LNNVGDVTYYKKNDSVDEYFIWEGQYHLLPIFMIFLYTGGWWWDSKGILDDKIKIWYYNSKEMDIMECNSMIKKKLVLAKQIFFKANKIVKHK